MAVTEDRRHKLHTKFEELIGPDNALTIMELLPPVGWADVATKRDLDQGLESLGNRLRAEWERGMRTYFMATLAANSGLLAVAFVVARGA